MSPLVRCAGGGTQVTRILSDDMATAWRLPGSPVVGETHKFRF